MICKGLFDNNTIVYVRGDYSTRQQIEQYAKNNGLKIKVTMGVWVNTPETETVLKVELLGEDGTPLSAAKGNTKRKIELYKKLLSEGKRQSEIAKILGVTREAVNSFISYHHIKKG